MPGLRQGEAVFRRDLERALLESSVALNAALDRLDALEALIQTGAGSPEGVVTATVGTLYLRTDGAPGTTLYSKETGSGNTGWEPK